MERKAGSIYNDKRLPSYCDRILWRSMPAVKHDFKAISLQSLTDVATSDHKPVCGIFSMRVRYENR